MIRFQVENNEQNRGQVLKTNPFKIENNRTETKQPSKRLEKDVKNKE